MTGRIIGGLGLCGLVVALAACGGEKKSKGCNTAGCTCATSAACAGELVCDPASKECRVALSCAELACVLHQLCQEAASKTDAVCLPECELGWFWNGAAGTCDAEPPSCLPEAPNSILALCDAQNRECVTGASGDTCGDCKATAVLVGEVCEPRVTCAALNCAAQHRGCEELPNGHCTDCLPGYVEDAGACRLPLDCGDITCPEYCVEPAEVADAYCVTGGCGPQAILGADGYCHACPACTNAAAGEAGPYLTELTGEGRCICATAQGYFWREGLFPGVTPCDADQDGWVRGSAKSAIESTSNAVRVNARCTLRTIDRFVLESEEGGTYEIPLMPTGTTLALYETDRNDDQVLVDQAVQGGALPAYGAGGRPLLAKELNTLTKACVSGQADFNENGLADVNEWHGNTALSAVQPYLRPFIDYAYFLELHRGWYDGGAYHIREKSRLDDAPAGLGVDLVYPPAANDFWRTCSRLRDSDYLTLAAAGRSLPGLDFARAGADGSGWMGMNHHSQFKCVRVVDARGAADPPHWLTPAMMDSDTYKYRPNRCAAVGQSVAPPTGTDAVNPWDATLSCATVAPSTLANGEVLMAAIDYVNYEAPGAHTRGCVNECIEYPDRCPGYDPDPRFNSAQCEGDVFNFGKLFCGCGYNYGGLSCEHPCPGEVGDQGPTSAGVSNLFLEWPFVLAPRTGYWLCGKPSATATVNGALPWLGEPTGYVVKGEIPMMHPASGALCENAGDCQTGYAVH